MMLSLIPSRLFEIINKQIRVKGAKPIYRVETSILY